MVKKVSAASGNKPKAAATKKPEVETVPPKKGAGWKLGGANDGNAPKPADEGFTTDTAGGAPFTEPPVDDDSVKTTEESSPKKSKGRRANAGHSPEQDASDDGAVNLTNMTSDLVHGVEALERLAEEQQALKDDAKEIVGELKSKGYSTKIIRKVLARRAMDPDKRKEEDTLLELYEEALRGA